MKYKPDAKMPDPTKKAMECAEAFRSTGTLTDLQGSYTGFYRMAGQMGVPLYTSCDYSMIVDDDDEEPVQDADDL